MELFKTIPLKQRVVSWLASRVVLILKHFPLLSHWPRGRERVIGVIVIVLVLEKKV